MKLLCLIAVKRVKTYCNGKVIIKNIHKQQVNNFNLSKKHYLLLEFFSDRRNDGCTKNLQQNLFLTTASIFYDNNTFLPM